MYFLTPRATNVSCIHITHPYPQIVLVTPLQKNMGLLSVWVVCAYLSKSFVKYNCINRTILYIEISFMGEYNTDIIK